MLVRPPSSDLAYREPNDYRRGADRLVLRDRHARGILAVPLDNPLRNDGYQNDDCVRSDARRHD